MDAVIKADVEDIGVEGEQIPGAALPCDAVYADQQCGIKEEAPVAQDEGEILLVQGLQDFQGVVSETVVVDDGQQGRQQHAAGPGLSRVGLGPNYQQYQPLVVQGFVTSSGEVVHVVQDPPGSGAHGTHAVHGAHRALNPSANLPAQPYQHAYQPQPQMVHPDLYRLIKMFPDFSTKTLHRIFVMCRCDLKRALDQALFARQFRQLDSAPSYSPIAPTSSQHAAHFPAAPYRAPARPGAPYMQMGMDMGDVYLPRGRASNGTAAVSAPLPQATPSSAPILLYQQAAHAAQPLGQHLHDVDDVVQVKLADLSSDVQIGQSLGDSLRLLSDGLGGAGAGAATTSLGPGGDSVCLDRGAQQDEDSKVMLPDLAEVTVEDSPHGAEAER